MTNAATRKAAGTSESHANGKSVDGSGGTVTTKGKLALRDSNGTTAAARGKTAIAGSKPLVSQVPTKPTRTEETQERATRVTRRAVTATTGSGGAAAAAAAQRSKSASTASTFSRSNSVQSDASRRTATSAKDERGIKRVKTERGEHRVAATDDAGALIHKAAASTAAEEAPRPKDEGWEDLDAEDADDPLMVAEYVNEIFEYMKAIEVDYLPSGNYIDNHPEITWEMRGVLVDWLVDIHGKFRLVPETLFLAMNLVDRFLTLRTISLNKLQLVGLTAMFVAAKYEEVLCPSVHNFLYLAEGGYTDEEILKAERYMLKVLKFNLSYASPMNFLRRISKADNYDIQTRTVAKFFMEISLVDHRFLEHPPSAIAAAAVWNARLVLERGDWHATLIHYSGYSVEELLPTAELMLDYCLRPVQHQFFIKKYSAKKFMKAATYVFEWSKKTYGDFAAQDPRQTPDNEEDEQRLRVDLFAQCGIARPVSVASSSERASTADLETPEHLTDDGELDAGSAQPFAELTNLRRHA